MNELNFLIVCLAGGLSLFAFIWRNVARKKRRAKLLATPLPLQWEKILENNVPIYFKLPDPLKSQLAGLIQIFLAEKRFEGCGGQEITDEVRVTIACQACMLLLNRATNYYPKLKTIYVYPSIYQAGDNEFRAGESWQNGPVVLAWNSVTGGAKNLRDGKNVVFHEFSHRLDQEDGIADGAPILEHNSCYTAWAQVLGEEYQTLIEKTEAGKRSVLRKYGATHPAEFFAVATEAFLEKPKQMQRKHPELYDELKEYYKLDPINWDKDSTSQSPKPKYKRRKKD